MHVTSCHSLVSRNTEDEMSCNAGGGQHDTSVLQMLLVYVVLAYKLL